MQTMQNEVRVILKIFDTSIGTQQLDSLRETIIQSLSQKKEIASSLTQTSILSACNAQENTILCVFDLKPNLTKLQQLEFCCEIESTVRYRGIHDVKLLLFHIMKTNTIYDFNANLRPISFLSQEAKVIDKPKDLKEVLKTLDVNLNATDTTRELQLNKAMRRAASNRNPNYMNILLCNNASVNAQDTVTTKYAPLHLAALKSRPDNMRFLLSKKADKNLVDGKGHTAFDYAIISNQLEVLILAKHLIPDNYVLSWPFFSNLFFNVDILLQTTSHAQQVWRVFVGLNHVMGNSKSRQQMIEFIAKQNISCELVTKPPKFHNLSPTLLGIYKHENKRIGVFLSNIQQHSINSISRILSHEFSHSLKRLTLDMLERKGQHKHEMNVIDVAPFYPFTKTEMLNFQNCVKVGFDRINKFNDLIEKWQSNQALDDDEAKHLEKYIAVSKGYQSMQVDYTLLKSTLSRISPQTMAATNQDNRYYLDIISPDLPDTPFWVTQFINKPEQKGVTLVGFHCDKAVHKPYLSFIYEMRLLPQRIPCEIGTNYPDIVLLDEYCARIIYELPDPIVECFFPELLNYERLQQETAFNWSIYQSQTLSNSKIP